MFGFGFTSIEICFCLRFCFIQLKNVTLFIRNFIVCFSGGGATKDVLLSEPVLSSTNRTPNICGCKQQLSAILMAYDNSQHRTNMDEML